MVNQDHGTELKTILEQDCKSMVQLIDLLEKERKLITKGSAEDIDFILKEKLDHFYNMQQLAKKRDALFDHAKLPKNADSMEKLIDMSPSRLHVELRTLWRQFQSHLKNCNRLNEINSTITNASKDNVDKILNIIHGKESDFELYDPTGTSIKPRQDNNKIDKA